MCFSCKGKGKGESNQPCIICNGTGLSPFARSILIGGKNFPDLMAYSIHEIFLWLLSFSHENSKKNQAIRNIPAGVRIIEAILSRLKPLEEMGLGYLKLNRTSATLSGGEIQKLRLGAQLGRDLTGILYILDEPAAALYASEKQSLWQNLIHLKNQGNTIILVEHNLDFIRSADHVIELGPGAADQGGDLIFSGTAEDMTKSNQSITGQYLKGNRCLKRYQHKRKIYNKIILCNARKNNLKNITVKFPLDCLVCVTGVSGCGKSTLVTDELYHALKGKFQEGSSIKTELVLKDKLFTIPEVILVDQAPLTKVRYSMPATYMRVFTHIKTLFSRVPEARRRGYKASYFGLTSKGGRCERCRGQGFLDLELQYLPSIKTNCDLCGGMRYSRETLKIKYKGLNIAEILNMTVKDAIDFFIKIPNIRVPLEAIEKIGLGYLKLGQPAHTLSGGEAQRLKLARELSKQTHGPTIYIMDEPCRGLHQKDLENFISVLDEFLEQGHSIIIIESRSDILDLADWIIKLGPGGGPEGGNIIAEGPPLIIKKGLQDIQPVAPFKFSSVNSIKLS
jgi:excinuclease ABC subunit A